jgi:molybdopterin-guanine dinucleotide biosynthesis protein A
VLALDDALMLSDPGLAAVDPDLASVRNLNDPGEYREARARPGPEIEVRRLRTPAPDGPPPAQRVAAWTLGQLADTIGLVLDDRVVAALNGDHVVRDRELPLAAGDTVQFMVTGAEL